MYVAIKLDKEKCIGCKMCIFVCPEANVIAFCPKSKKVEVNEARCKGCGLCVVACPKDALSLDNN
ncbi:MAG: NADH-quinone oxidoreductase subunit I [Firmicutes bacterium]|nr:NADH-quinone oxidoreductase subunit I [Bacillota bacterium]MBT9157803.1 NADH-quinone oxidoreductase subunit I [Bacillota bacterium]